MKTRKTWLIASALGILTLLFASCGRNWNGSYLFSQSFAGSSLCGSQTLSVNFYFTSQGSSVSGQGTAQSTTTQCFISEQFTGTDIGNAISPATLTINMPGSQPCTYTGTLPLSGNQVMGTLNVQQQAAPQGGGQPQYNGACPFAVQMSGTLTR